MKSLISRLILAMSILILVLAQLVQPQEQVEKYSKVKISIKNISDVKELQKAGLSLEGMKYEENSLEVMLSEREIIKLDELGYPYQILIDDMTKFYQERNRRTKTELKILEDKMKKKYIKRGGFGFGSMGGYYTFDEVVAQLDTMRVLYPNLITEKDSIGSTVEGRTLWLVKISDNPDIDEDEPAIFYNSLIHAREPEGMMVVMYFMWHLLENYGQDPEITYLVDNREFYFLPVVNPDGYCYNEQNSPDGGGMWRKNKRINEGGCVGVNNNCNFGYMWGYNDIGSSGSSCATNYRGTEGFSEFENQTIRDFCESHNIKICNNYHTYWDVVFTPWAYNLTQTPDSSLFNHIIDLGTQFNNYLNGNGYVPGNYEVNGDVCDWMYGEQTTKPKIIAFLTEVGDDHDGFWPKPERIFPLAEDNFYLNMVLAWGPGVIDNPAHIFEGNVYPAYCEPLLDSVSIIATESNPEKHSSEVTAFIISSDSNTVDEFQLIKIDSIHYAGTRQVPEQEDFYTILLKDTGIEVPSNFYYKKNLKFTTAGPITVDSLAIDSVASTVYQVKPYLKNKGQSCTIKNVKINLLTEDSSITRTLNHLYNISSIPPGEIVAPSGALSVWVDSTFTREFNFIFAIMSDEWVYWTDTIRIVVPTGVEEEVFTPLNFSLSQNHPNPFNPSTIIGYQLAEGSKVTLKVYDILGREIVTLIDEYKSLGRYEFEFNATDLPSGVYFYQLKAGDFIKTKKMVLLR